MMCHYANGGWQCLYFMASECMGFGDSLLRTVELLMAGNSVHLDLNLRFFFFMTIF